jgi:hypothetical protein
MRWGPYHDRGKIFFLSAKCLDWSWGSPLSHQFNGYWGQRSRLIKHHPIVLRLSMSGALFCFSYVLMACTGTLPCLFRHVRKIVKATINFVISARIEKLGSHWTYFRFDVWIFCNLSGKFKFYYNLTRNTGTLHEDQCIFISRRILLRMRNVSDML